MPLRLSVASLSPLIRLIIGVVVFLGGVGLVLYHGRWVRCVFQGPVSTTLADLEGLEDPKTLSNPWISLSFHEAMNTGLIMESTKSGLTTPRSKYLLIRVGPRWLLTDVPTEFAGNQVVGYLDTWWSPLSKKVVAEVKGRYPAHNILPYQLNAEYSYRGQCFALLGIAAFIGVVGIAIGGFALADMWKTRRKPKKLKRRRSRDEDSE